MVKCFDAIGCRYWKDVINKIIASGWRHQPYPYNLLFCNRINKIPKTAITETIYDWEKGSKINSS
jgi:hypothetical protein